MKEDIGTSKPQKCANKVQMVLTQEVNVGLKLNKSLPYNRTCKYRSLSFALQQCRYSCRVIWKSFVNLGPTLTSCVSTILTFFAYFLSFDILTSSFPFNENVFYYSCIVSSIVFSGCFTIPNVLKIFLCKGNLHITIITVHYSIT